MAACSALTGAGSYGDRESGDESYASKDYAVAASFYARYRDQARSAGDVNAERDAFERQLDALIFGGMPDVASGVLAEFEKRFPDANPISLALWKADLALLGKRPVEARETIQAILPQLTVDDPRRTRALMTLGRACEENGLYRRAADTYEKMREGKISPQLQRFAFERAVFCLASSDKPQEAFDELLSAPVPESPGEGSAMNRLLALYAVIRVRGFSEVEPFLGRAFEAAEKSGDPLAYTVLSAVADSAVQAGKFQTAADALQSAFRCAPDKSQSFQTIQRLVDVLDSTGDVRRAAGLALQSLQLFRGSYASPELRLKIAGILRSAGNYSEADSLLESIAADPLTGKETVRRALLERAYLHNDMNDYPGAAKIVEKYFTDDFAGEGAFILADMLFLKKKYDDAAAGFLAAADRYPAWRAKSLYQAALALLQAGRPENALAVITRLEQVKEDPAARIDAVFLKAVALEATGKPGEAIQFYEEYSGLPGAASEKASQALFKAGRISVTARNYERAEQFFRRLVRLHPGSDLAAPAGYWLIFALHQRGEEIQAERETWLLADRHPESSYAIHALFNLAARCVEAGALPRADAVLDDLARRVKSDELRARVLFERAAVAFRRKNYTFAKELLSDLQKRYSDSRIASQGVFLSADILRAEGEYVKAAEAYRSAAAAEPDPMISAAATGSAGDCLFILAGLRQLPSRYAEARADFLTAASRKNAPEQIRVMSYYKAGRTYELTGDDDTALEYYSMALRIPDGESMSASKLWAAKAAEAVCSIAEKRPLRVHIAAARAALERMNSLGMIDQETLKSKLSRITKSK